MAEPLPLLSYPLPTFLHREDGGLGGDCGCKYASYPQFYAVWDSLYRQMAKGSIGLAEFEENDSGPPRFFLRRVTTYRCWTATFETSGPELLLYSKIETYDFDTDSWDVQYGEGDEDAMDCLVASEPFTATEVIETATTRRTITTRTDGAGNILAVHTVMQVLSDEFTTRWLIDHVLDSLVWDEDMPPAGWYPFYVSASEQDCYANPGPTLVGYPIFAPGPAPGRPEFNNYIVPGIWLLTEDEAVLTVQKVRYKIILPHYFNGLVFRVKWDERWAPVESGSPPSYVSMARDRTSGGGETETDTIEMEIVELNGVVTLQNFRLAAA